MTAFLLPVKQQVKAEQKLTYVVKRTEIYLSYCDTPALGRLVDLETFSSLPFPLWSSRAPQTGYSCFYLSDWMAEDCLECGRSCGSGVQLGLSDETSAVFFVVLNRGQICPGSMNPRTGREPGSQGAATGQTEVSVGHV